MHPLMYEAAELYRLTDKRNRIVEAHEKIPLCPRTVEDRWRLWFVQRRHNKLIRRCERWAECFAAIRERIENAGR